MYTILETVIVYQTIFDRCEDYDANFRTNFMSDEPRGKVDFPKKKKKDWEVVGQLVRILEHFYELTICIFGSLYVTSITFLDEIYDVHEVMQI